MNAPQRAIGGMVDRVRDYLRSADLTIRGLEEFAGGLGVHPNTVHNHLREAGVLWRDLRRAEQLRRLEQILDRPGKLHAEQAAEVCGFTETSSFFRFFLAVKGQNYTDWRRQLQ